MIISDSVACLAADPGMMRFAGLLKRPTLPRHAPIRQEAASDRASAHCQDLLRNGNNRFLAFFVVPPTLNLV